MMALSRRGLALGGLGVLAAGGTAAQPTPAWQPDRPLRLVVPFAPGGNTDAIARVSAEWLGARLGQTVVVENRSGANGALAAELVTRSRPDGHTLLMAAAPQMAVLPALTRLNYDPERDFAPVSIVASNVFALAVAESTGIANLPDFLARLRREPDGLAYASAGNGSVSHLAMALLLQAGGGLKMLHVPYRGGGPAMQELLGGRIATYFANVAEVLPHVAGGRIRILGTSGAARTPAMPDVPTVAEQGLPGFAAETWNGIAAPAATPEVVLDRLALEMGAACADIIVRERLARLGVDPVCNSRAGFAATLRADLVRWREAVRASGAVLD